MRRAAPIAAILLGAAASPALADRIDGNWCDAAGHSLSIDGSRITTPGGAAISGEYARHEFAYMAPAHDADSGRVVYMRLLDDDDMESVHVKDGKADGDVTAWHRCKPVS